jgi:hypothetical protein
MRYFAPEQRDDPVEPYPNKEKGHHSELRIEVRDPGLAFDVEEEELPRTFPQKGCDGRADDRRKRTHGSMRENPKDHEERDESGDDGQDLAEDDRNPRRRVAVPDESDENVAELHH